MWTWSLILALIACGGDPEGPDPVSDTDVDEDVPGWYPADEVGPYKAGTAEFVITGRTGVTMKVQLWYPTSEQSGMTHSYDGLLSWEALDTPEPDCRTTRPVLAFSHGNQGMRWQSPFMVEHLATHGFVVVAPDHTGNSTFDYNISRLPELIFRRPFDIQDSVDWLFDEASGELDGLGGCLDEANGYAVSGHSFGGYTTNAVAGASFDYAASSAYCESAGGWLCDEVQAWIDEYPEFATVDLRDDRVWGAIPMAPAGFEVLGPGAPDAEVPFLVLGGELDNMTPMATQVTPIYEALGSEDKRLGMLIDGGHMVFSNACEMAPMSECESPYLDFELAHPAISTTVTAWLQLQLGHDAALDTMPFDSPLWDWGVQ